MRPVPSTSDVYFSSEEEFGVKALFPSQTTNFAPGPFAISLLNSAYFASAPDTKTFESTTWESWLQSQLGILREPRLIDRGDPAKLSKLFTLLAAKIPDMFLGTLQRHWKTYERILTPEITQAISSIKVPCTNGKMVELRSTLLPSLKALADVFLRDKETFPFLALHAVETADEWTFLAKFGAHRNDDLKFYLVLLLVIRKGKGLGEKLVDPERIFKLYEAIYTKYLFSLTKDIDKKQIR